MKEEKLTIEHLAPYLPYSLTYQYDGVVYMLNSSIGDLTIGYDDNQDSWHSIVNCKPILRPLSDLELDIYKNKIFNREYIIDKRTDSDLGYYEWCYLFENHFDVFGLIEKGLAINKNDI